nr:NB-ARC domains-containing protein [Tanacetum cinerariifolium]
MATKSVLRRWKYDVFVSFRGDDIRKNFMDHMFNDFMHKGIHAFRDDRELPKGDSISPHLYKAIEESRFLIVIFSKNYASSSWCLQELVKTRELKISNVGQGIMVIKKMMSSKPILLVLDDVDHREQLKALAGSPSWFFPVSLIIFTAKDKQLLRSHRVDVQDMDFLDEDESLELFSSYAFEDKWVVFCT